MKRLIVVASVGLMAACVLAGFQAWEPTAVEVSPTPVMLVPPCSPTNVGTWSTSTVYAVGDFVKNTNKPPIMYWCRLAGTSTNGWGGMPISTLGDDTTDTNCTWRPVRMMREHLTITAPTTTAMRISFGSSNGIAAGIRIKAGEMWVAPADMPRCAIWGYTEEAVTNNAGVQEN